MQARYYDPVIGRFLSIDPVGFSPTRPDMFNRYAYAANDPVNMWDPDGMASCGSLRQKRCDTAKTAAHAASASYAELAKKLQSLAKAIDSGKRLTGDQKVLKSQIESKFGKEATKTSTLGAVATRMQGISDFLGPGGKAVLDTGNEEIDPDTGTVPYAYASFGSNSIGINNAFFDEKELEDVGLSQRALMGHEAGHSLYDTSDWHNIGGLRISGYGQAGASRILTYQNRHPSLISTLTNTDSYTCLVLSEECGR